MCVRTIYWEIENLQNIFESCTIYRSEVCPLYNANVRIFYVK